MASMAVMEHYDQSNLGREGLFGLHFHTVVYHWRRSGQELKQGRNLEAGAEAEAMEGATHWLAPHGLLRQLSYRTQVQLHSQWAGPSPIND